SKALPKDPAKVSAPGEFPIVAESVTLKVFIPSAGLIRDIKTNTSSVWIEKLTGVKVEWIETTKVDAKAKLSLMIASGDYPDVIMGMSAAGLGVQDVQRYGKQGNFIALNGLIDKQGYYIKDLFKVQPEMLGIITGDDGNIYGLPAVFTDDYHMTMRQKMWINQAWLDKLDLKMPTTTDELYKVLRAFKTRDPNGNALADEIPLSGAKRSQEDLASWIMCAFIPAGGPDDGADATLNNYEFVRGGSVHFSADKPEFREGLRYLARLYREGLIDVAGLTQDRSQIKPLVDGTTVRVGAVASHHPGNFASLSDDASANVNRYKAIPPIAGPKGVRATPWIIDQVIQPGQFVITDRCRNPVVAFRWADAMFSLEWALKEKGDEGTHWAKAGPKDGLLGLNGKGAKYKYLKVLTPDDNAQINAGPVWTRDLKNEFAKAQAMSYSYEEFLYNATKAYEPYKVRRFPFATMSIDDGDIVEFNDLRRNIHAFVGESVDRFIIGDMDIERQWDGYVEQLGQIGLDRYLEILHSSLSSR
ncbi:MAG: extracellular solute-binding protein, partial [Spirochaetaceae bacterium]|nr:extracellular solute-binding protein [Spirochaetaceae bacterium]